MNNLDLIGGLDADAQAKMPPKKVRGRKAKKDRLKPCPFCGADKPEILPQSYGYLVVCRIRCGGQLVVAGSNLRQVPYSWNNRHEQAKEEKSPKS